QAPSRWERDIMRVSCLLLLFVLCPLLAVEQSGTVRSNGLAIPRATVIATQGAQRLITTTDDSGRYTYPSLTARAWAIEVELFASTPGRRDVIVGSQPAALEWTLALKPLQAPAPVPTPNALAEPAPVSKASPARPEPNRRRGAFDRQPDRRGF